MQLAAMLDWERVGRRGRQPHGLDPINATAGAGARDEEVAHNEFKRLCNRASEIVFELLHDGTEIVHAIDAVFDDEDWSSTMRGLLKFYTRLPRPPLIDERIEERFPWTTNPHISPQSKRVAARCVQSLNAIFRAHDALNRNRVSIPASLSEEATGDHLWFLFDPEVPEPLRRVLLAHRRGSVALIATYPVTHPAPAPVARHFGFALKLLGFAADAFNEYLAVLANFEGAEIPRTIAAPDGDLRVGEVDGLASYRDALRAAGEDEIDAS